MDSGVIKKKLKAKIYRKLKTTYTKTVSDAKTSLSPGVETHTPNLWVQETGRENYRYEASFNYRVSSHPPNLTHEKWLTGRNGGQRRRKGSCT